MLAVVSVLSTSLVAVPALSRVEPARTSGPGAGAMTTFALTPRARLHVTITVRAPARRAAACRTSAGTPRPRAHRAGRWCRRRRRSAARGRRGRRRSDRRRRRSRARRARPRARRARLRDSSARRCGGRRDGPGARSRGWPARWRAAHSGGRAPWRAWYHRLRYHLRVPAVLTGRSEEHTSELQSQFHLVCRLLL